MTRASLHLSISLLAFILVLISGQVRLRAADSELLPTVDKVSGLCALHRTIVIHAKGLADWAKSKNPSDLLVYLNGMALEGVVPQIDLVQQDKLLYKLERDPANSGNVKVWNSLLAQPQIGNNRSVRVTVGLEGHPFQVDGNIPTIKLRAINPIGITIYSLMMLGLLFGVFQLARYSDLIRDDGRQPAQGRKTFSLARTQMAFWFLLIVGAYGFIWLASGATDTITASVLGLMGISAATGLAAAAVDSSKKTQADAELEQLQRQQASLQAEQTQQGGAFPADKIQQLQDVSNAIVQRQRLSQPAQSSGFFDDILSDANGISFHRLQIAVWTVVLGMVFVFSVYNALSMPTFSETLLVLMGISGGTYIGFKIPEAQA
jgi:hypothetical protein